MVNPCILRFTFGINTTTITNCIILMLTDRYLIFLMKNQCTVIIITCKTDAPAWRNCSPVSAESIPPVAKIGKPGIALAMADTALRAMGLMALPVQIVNIAKCWIEAPQKELAQCVLHVSN